MTRAISRVLRQPVAKLTSQAIKALRRLGPMTADECAEAIGVSPLSLRPRFSELRRDGQIDLTGFRRWNASGRKANVWRLV